MAKQPRNSYTLDDVLRPEARESLKHLELIARRTVQGFLHGMHRSKRKGVSTEFDHHKLYQPGDPLKHVDWKASARHGRYYVKRYLEDTALTVHMVVDHSGSMRRASGEGPSKYLQTARLAACLAYLILKERDRVGLALNSAGGTLWLPASARANHFVAVLQALVASEASEGDGLDGCLKTLLERGERRGLVALLSDLMFDPVPVQRQLARLQAQGHEVLVLQVRDPAEEDFPFNRWVQFQNLEVPGVQLRVDTVPLKKLYREEYAALTESWQRWAKKYDVHWVSTRADASMETVLSEYLAYRQEIRA